MKGTKTRLRRAAVRAAAAAVLTVALLAGGPPAVANHQNCGERYPGGSHSNGHPDTSWPLRPGWAGQVAVNELDSAVFAATQVKTTLLNSAAVTTAVAEVIHQAYDVAPDPAEPIISVPEEVTRAVASVLVFAGLGALIAETALLTTQLQLNADVNAENACNNVLGGDMLDQIWVATVERNLASDGPPLALLLTPTDSEEPGAEEPGTDSGQWPLQPQHEEEDFAWCPAIDLPDELPEPAAETDLDGPNGESDGGDCTPGYHDGFLDEPYSEAPRVTVQSIVRDTIDHATAHGLPVRDAEDHYADAVTALDAQRYKEAFQHFRLAYQDAAGFDG